MKPSEVWSSAGSVNLTFPITNGAQNKSARAILNGVHPFSQKYANTRWLLFCFLAFGFVNWDDDTDSVVPELKLCDPMLVSVGLRDIGTVVFGPRIP